MDKLQRFLERLPDTAAVIKLKTGSSTKHVLEAVYVFDGMAPKLKKSEFVPELIDRNAAESIILEEAENLGWGEDFTHVRLHAYDEDMQHLKSLSMPRKLEAAAPIGSDQSISALTQGMLQMSAEIRRTLSVVTESLAHRESMHSEIIESLLEAKRDQAEAEARHMHLENYLDDEGIRDSDDFRKTAVEQLGSILETVIAAKSSNGIPTIVQLKNWLSGNPDMLDAMFDDQDLMDTVMSAYMARQAEADN